ARSGGGGGFNVSVGAGRPTASASAATAGPTSATERGDIECSVMPAARSALASSMRFSSSLTTTRSGARATIAATSGFFVPPTVGSPGCSQKRVHAIGVTPSASRVSVADGTSETTRGAALTCAPSHTFEQLRLLRLELGRGDAAAVAPRGELLELFGPARPPARRARGRRRRRGRRARCAPPGTRAVVLLHLLVQLVLHRVGVP